MNHGMSGMLSRRTLRRYLRFGLVGGSGVLVDMGVLFLFSDPRTLGWGLSLSKTLAAETAIVNNFIWNDIWTFQDLSAGNTGWGARARRFAKFNLVCLAGIGINVLLLTVQVHSCVFQRKRTPVPIQSGHSFQLISDSCRSEATLWG